MSLNAWLSYGWLTEHEPTAAEIHDLLALIERDLGDSAVIHLSPDWRLNIAYNAALQAATAALAAAGYRASREAHHYRAIQSLALTIGSPSSVIAASISSARSGTLGVTSGQVPYPTGRQRK